MHKKSDTILKYQEFSSMISNKTGRHITTLRTDGGGEYMSTAFDQLLKSHGTRHEVTIPHTPEQNGVAERLNQTLINTTKCLLKTSNLDNNFWVHAMLHAVTVRNMCPTSGLPTKTVTPYELWNSEKPDFRNLHLFGSIVYAKNPHKNSKLDDNAIKCIYLGNAQLTKGYRVFNPRTAKGFISRSVMFTDTFPSTELVEVIAKVVKKPDNDNNIHRGTIADRAKYLKVGGIRRLLMIEFKRSEVFISRCRRAISSVCRIE